MEAKYRSIPSVFKEYPELCCVQPNNRKNQEADANKGLTSCFLRGVAAAIENPIGRILSYAFGYERDLPLRPSYLNVGIGAQVTGYGIPSLLESVYGQHPVSNSFFLCVRPTGNIAAHTQMIHRH
jgi:hypothetical protein